MAKTESKELFTTFTYDGTETVNALPASAEECLTFLYNLSKSNEKGILPAGFVMYRGDSRELSKITKDGFAPLYPKNTDKTELSYARKHAKGIINIKPDGFIYAWKQPSRNLEINGCGLEYIVHSVDKDKWYGKLSKCKSAGCPLTQGNQKSCPNYSEGRETCAKDDNWTYYNRMGVAFGITEFQMGGVIYKITMPQMYKLMNHTYRKHTVSIYGNATTLDDSTEIAMHLVGIDLIASTEFVFLTSVPADWIEELTTEKSMEKIITK